ncbi:MAG: hypothetical protein Kow0088_20810 [Anaerolineales bacterium]
MAKRVNKFPTSRLVNSKPTLRKKKICIVSDDLIGPIRNGGIGTACSSLGETLAKAGHDVTLLYSLGTYTETNPVDYWIHWYKEKNIQFVPFPENSMGVKLDAPFYISRSLEIYQWLKGKSFDLIYFPEWRGRGYHTVVAKHQGLAFHNTIICVGIHSPTLWERQGNHEYLNQLAQVEMDFMERQCVALADAVISPSQYMLNWAKSEGWELPTHTIVQQNILPGHLRKASVDQETITIIPNELIFFGRLYYRKGLILFCDALDRLKNERSIKVEKITFLGKSVEVDGIPSDEYIRKRAEKWPWQLNILTNYNQQEATQYLSKAGGLTIIASLVENSPYTVLECLGAGIPFLTSNVGGIPELIHEDDRETVCFAPNPEDLFQKIVHVLEEGIFPARPAVPFDETEKKWLDWIDESTKLQQGGEDTPDNERPLVSICLTHYNRPQFLKQALMSLQRLTYPNYEVVLVDDGSNKLEGLYYLKVLKPYFEAKGWQIIRQQNKYLGAARNTAARHARGEYLLFMDDDNIAKPFELDVFIQVAKKTKADILTCVMDLFVGDCPPRGSRAYWIPLGACVTAGAFKNCFGDANALIRKDVFWKLGGFTEDYGIGHEDWEFFSKAVLQGFKLEVVPEALYYYRQSRSGMLRSGDMYLNHRRNIRPYLEVDPRISQLIEFAQGQYYYNEILLSDNNALRRVNDVGKTTDLISDVLAIKQLISEGESELTLSERLSKILKQINLLSSIKDLRLRLTILLVCAESFVDIREYTLALEAFENALKISDLLNDDKTSTFIEQRKLDIGQKNHNRQTSQFILDKILSSEDIYSALNTYRNELSIDLVDEIYSQAQQYYEHGNPTLAEGLVELAEHVLSLINDKSL